MPDGGLSRNYVSGDASESMLEMVSSTPAIRNAAKAQELHFYLSNPYVIASHHLGFISHHGRIREGGRPAAETPM